MAKASKQSKSSMGESARLARALMHCTGTGIYIVQDGKFQYVNSLFQELAGYTEKELIGMRSLDLVYPEDREKVREKAIENLRGQHPVPYEYRVIRKNGEVTWVLERLSSIEYRGKRAAVGSFMDITDRKLMEQELADEATRRRILIEQSRDGIHVLDSDGKVVEANNRFAEMLGYSPEEVSELHMWDWDTQFTREELLGMVRSVDAAGDHFETQMCRKDGMVIDVELSTNGAEIAGQKLVFCVCRDITERKRAEKALALEATRRRILIEQSRDGVVVLDENGKVYEVNQQFAKMLGYSLEEARELSVWDWEFQFPREQVQEMIRSVDEKGDHFETRHRRKDGSIYDVEISTNAAVIAGQKLIFCVCRDITERKQAEEAIRRSEENFHDVIENSPLGIRVIDKDWKTLYANRALLNFWGYSSLEELEAVPREQRYTPQTYVEHLERLEKRKRGEPAPLSYETSIVRSDGEVRILSVSRGELLWNGEKQFQLVSQDITEYKRLEEALAKSEERYRTVLEQMEEAYYEVDNSGNFTFFNDAMCRQLGYSREELTGMNYRKCTPEADVQRVFKAFNQVYRTGKPIKGIPMGWVRKDGTRIFAETSAFPLFNESGEIIGFRGIILDVTERAQMIKALSESEERYRTILAEIEEGYYEVNLAGDFTFVNDAICCQLGYSREELIGMNYLAYVLKEEAKGIYKAWNKVYRTGKSLKSYPFTAIKKDGTQVFLESSISPLRSNEGRIIGFRSISRDVTEHKQFERRLEEMATHDSLTGLPNRLLLSDRFTVALALSRRTRNRLAILMLDLDRFKAVNDSLGHGVGDQLLKAVGKRLVNTMRKSDTIARVGGDEFVVVLPQISQADEAAKLAQRILEAFREPFVCDSHRLHITTSIGVAVYPEHGEDIESLLKNADTAMYWAKEQGRSIYKLYDAEAFTLLTEKARVRA
jgi:diguanylate cyclase (GGDEF)-like protein/PAS domain S-box-containing protein